MTIVKVHLYQFFVEEEDNTFGYKSFGFWQNPDTSLQNIRNTALYCSVVPANRFLCYSADSRRHFSDLDMDPSLIALFPDPADCPHT